MTLQAVTDFNTWVDKQVYDRALADQIKATGLKMAQGCVSEECDFVIADLDEQTTRWPLDSELQESAGQMRRYVNALKTTEGP